MNDAPIPLVSVIMPAFNAEEFISEAITSVLSQTHSNLELLLVNDGSTDGTETIVRSFQDPRIRYFQKENGGIGSARNVALEHMRGDFICFCDSDDTIPPRSVAARLDLLLRDSSLHFADGVVHIHGPRMEEIERVFKPTFKGEPLEELVRLTGSCFFGSSWMLRWDQGMKARFSEEISHAEDLLFFMNIAPGKRYGYVDEVVYNYRVTGRSSMSNIDGLARSYRHLLGWMVKHLHGIPMSALRQYRWKTTRIIVSSYLKAGCFMKALKALFLQGVPLYLGR